MMSRLILAGAIISFLVGGAVAQSNDPSTSQTPVAPPVTGNDASANGIKTAKSADVGVQFGASAPADIMSSNLVGIEVFSKQNEKIGKVEDLAIEAGKTIKGLVVSVGGFLGVGERYVLVDPASVVVHEQDGRWKAFVDMSRDALKNAPEFKYKGKS
jgi:sporulation protein YlmC with PRC-barrel domain